MTNEEKLQALCSERDKLTAQLSAVNEQIYSLAREMIPAYAKHQVGEEISARGKTYRITRVIAVVHKSENKLSFEYYGHENLKGGGLHKTERHLYWLSW